MSSKSELSIKLLKEATEAFLQKIRIIKKKEQKILEEINKEEDQKKIQDIKNKLGI